MKGDGSCSRCRLLRTMRLKRSGSTWLSRPWNAHGIAGVTPSTTRSAAPASISSLMSPLPSRRLHGPTIGSCLRKHNESALGRSCLESVVLWLGQEPQELVARDPSWRRANSRSEAFQEYPQALVVQLSRRLDHRGNRVLLTGFHNTRKRLREIGRQLIHRAEFRRALKLQTPCSLS